MSESSISPEVHKKRPGGPLIEKPFQNDDRSWSYKGKEIPEQKALDISYSIDFWRGKSTDPEYRRNLREAMIENIRDAFDEHREFATFVSPEGITEEDKMKISAYRVLAEEVGYKIGELKFDKNSHTASGSIERTKP